VQDDVREIYRDRIIPHWLGASMRDVLFAQMTLEWRAAYDAGVFTEFMEQRAPGHTVLDGRIYQRGMRQFQYEIDRELAALTICAIDPPTRQEQLRAMRICADAIVAFAARHAAAARARAAQERDPRRRVELLRIAEVCARVPAEPPRDFHEALQAYWFVHLGVIIELNTWDSFNPGHLDQHLYPFYRRGLDEARQ
jgi:formate C-acetyltransferase